MVYPPEIKRVIRYNDTKHFHSILSGLHIQKIEGYFHRLFSITSVIAKSMDSADGSQSHRDITSVAQIFCIDTYIYTLCCAPHRVGQLECVIAEVEWVDLLVRHRLFRSRSPRKFEPANAGFETISENESGVYSKCIPVWYICIQRMYGIMLTDAIAHARMENSCQRPGA